MVCVAASAAFAAGARAGEPAVSPVALPAVDGINAKAEAYGGSLAGKSLGGAAGAFSVPLASLYGLQLDSAAGRFDGSRFSNLAGHAFWRDPGRGLVGLYTSHTWWDRNGGVYLGQVAGEGELYLGRFALQGIAGVEFGNIAQIMSTSTSTIAPGFPDPFVGGAPGVTTTTTFLDSYAVKTRFFDQVNLKYYLSDQWTGYVGHRYLGGRNALALGSEVALPLGRGVLASAFVEGRAGEANMQSIWGGVKFYFGGNDKPLLARHRQDDPNIWSTDTLFSLVNSHSSSSSSTSTQFCGPGTVMVDGDCYSLSPPGPPGWD
jgi:hypothetical protein